MEDSWAICSPFCTVDAAWEIIVSSCVRAAAPSTVANSSSSSLCKLSAAFFVIASITRDSPSLSTSSAIFSLVVILFKFLKIDENAVSNKRAIIIR